MSESYLPQHVRPLDPTETFPFRCHPEVSCFNECCRELELALTPYDVLRLSQALGLKSNRFLEQYAVIEGQESDKFPQVFLGMVDDGRASCPFVTTTGCSVYENRPGACRTYPLGRGASKTAGGEIKNIYVIIREPHCQGHREKGQQNLAQWEIKQGIGPYNFNNDKILAIQQHPEIKSIMPLSAEQKRLYLLALYDLDSFRIQLQKSEPNQAPAMAGLQGEALLDFSINWLRHELFDD